MLISIRSYLVADKLQWLMARLLEQLAKITKRWNKWMGRWIVSIELWRAVAATILPAFKCLNEIVTILAVSIRKAK